MLSKRDLFIIFALAALAAIAALVQATSPRPPASLSDEDDAIRAELNAYMVARKSGRAPLDADCRIAPPAHWSFEGRARALSGALQSEQRRMQIMVVTQNNGKGLRLRYILARASNNKSKWQMVDCAAIGLEQAV